MKKLKLVLLLMILVIFAQGQALDAVIVNGIVNPGAQDEANFRSLNLDIYPVNFGFHESFLGVYVQMDEYYAKNEQKDWVSRFNQIHLGLTFNTTFGYSENWYVKGRAGIGWIETHSATDFYKYRDEQNDNTFLLSTKLSHWREDLKFLGRHQLDFFWRTPYSQQKVAYWKEEKIDVQIWNNEIVRLSFTETAMSIFMDQTEDWKFNLDLTIGMGMEHRLVDGIGEKLVYPRLGAGVSIFKVPYHYQNMLELGIEQQFQPINRWMITAKVNLVPLIYLIWEKELVKIGD